MKKSIYILLPLVFTAFFVNASQVTWGGGNYTAPVDGVTLQEGWLLVVYKDSNKDNNSDWYNQLRLDQDGSVTSTGVTSDDEVLNLLSYTATLAKPIPALEIFNFSKQLDNVPDNTNIYTVLFDSTAIASASNFIVADNTPVSSGDGLSPVTYNIGTTFTGDWQAIPEPAVASFIMIFGGGMLVGRRIFSKS